MSKTPAPISHNVKEHHLFLASGDKKYSYGDLFSFGAFFKEHLEEYEISAKRPLGLHAESSDTLVFVIATCWLHNIPFAPFNPKAKSDTLAKQINDIHPGLLIIDSPVKKLSDQVPTVSIDRFDRLEKIPNDHSLSLSSDPQQFDYPDKETFGYFFTSGTSDEPKIVPLKRRQMYAAAEASAQNLKPRTNEAWLLCLPLYHIGGISVVLRSLIYGSAIYRLDCFDEGVASELLFANQQIVAASLVPTMLERLIENPGFAIHKSFKSILLGGGPISPELPGRCIRRNIPIITSYGMTETCAQIAANPIYSDPENPALLKSVGKIFPTNKIEIRNKNNEIVSAGKSGTIWLKGLQVFDGYHNAASQDDFDENGWFNTGDFGRIDTNGNLYIEARRTDLIITGGENVSPIEVENALQNIDEIKEAAVFGVLDSEWGQKVMAAVVLKKDDLTTGAIKTILKEKLEDFKIPKQFIFVESLPRTETGKLKRSELEGLLK